MTNKSSPKQPLEMDMVRPRSGSDSGAFAELHGTKKAAYRDNLDKRLFVCTG
ncbi:hypothetical protein QUF64_01995 [Anaerolineales bacterium HSG6]|nr:hypothetical protein [Anaerolineales bacterium HSG6]